LRERRTLDWHPDQHFSSRLTLGVTYDNSDTLAGQPFAPNAKGFLGSSLTYNSKTYAGLGALNIQRTDAYALLDLRAGAEREQGRYRVWAWGKNVTDRYYWSNVLPYGNAISRYLGQPATYGFSISARF
jgi:iron complex outermembrane receptor protein